MVLWFYGSMVLWFYGSMVLWFYDREFSFLNGIRLGSTTCWPMKSRINHCIGSDLKTLMY